MGCLGAEDTVFWGQKRHFEANLVNINIISANLD
jgi:hypothetical protein